MIIELFNCYFLFKVWIDWLWGLHVLKLDKKKTGYWICLFEYTVVRSLAFGLFLFVIINFSRHLCMSEGGVEVERERKCCKNYHLLILNHLNISLSLTISECDIAFNKLTFFSNPFLLKYKIIKHYLSQDL